MLVTHEARHAAWADRVVFIRDGVVADRLPGRPVDRMRADVWTADRSVSLRPVAADCRGAGDECSWFPEGVGSYSTPLGAEVVVVDAATLAATTAPVLRDEVLAAFETRRVVLFGGGAVDDSGAVRLQASEWDGEADRPLGSVALPATEIAVSPTETLMMPALVVVPPELADRLPAPLDTTMLVVGGPDASVTQAEEQRLREGLTAPSSASSVYVERGFSDALAVVRWLLVAVGGALVLVATLTATGLALTDARPDFATLGAIGAPRIRRLMAMGSAAVVGGLGAALGVLAGLAPGIAVAHPLTSNDYGAGARPLVDVPWLLLAAVAVAVPLLAVLVTGLFVRSCLPMTARLPG